MCNLSEAIGIEERQEGIKIGLEQGIEQGLEKGLILGAYEFGATVSDIAIKFSISEEQIRRILKEEK